MKDCKIKNRSKMEVSFTGPSKDEDDEEEEYGID